MSGEKLAGGRRDSWLGQPRRQLALVDTAGVAMSRKQNNRSSKSRKPATTQKRRPRTQPSPEQVDWLVVIDRVLALLLIVWKLVCVFGWGASD